MVKLVFMVGYIVAGLAWGHGAIAQEIPTLQVGVILPMTGSQAPYGAEFLRGADLAYEFFVKEDPALAEKLKLIKVDDASQPKTAAEATEKLISKERVQIIFGAVAGANSDAITEVTAKHGVPFISPIVTATLNQDSKIFFPVSLSNRNQGSLLGVYAAEMMKTKKAAVLWDGVQSNLPVVEAFEKTYEKRGGKVVHKIRYELGVSDYKVYLKELRSKSPEVILLPTYYSTAAEIMRHAKEMSWPVKFLGTDGWDSPRLLQAAGRNANGHVFVSHYAADRHHPSVQKFRTAFIAKHKREPGSIAALAFDGMNLLIDVFRRSKTALKDPLLREFQKTDFDGVTGRVAYQEKGQAIKSGIIMEVEKEKFKFKTDVIPRSLQTKS